MGKRRRMLPVLSKNLLFPNSISRQLEQHSTTHTALRQETRSMPVIIQLVRWLCTNHLNRKGQLYDFSINLLLAVGFHSPIIETSQIPMYMPQQVHFLDCTFAVLVRAHASEASKGYSQGICTISPRIQLAYTLNRSDQST